MRVWVLLGVLLGSPSLLVSQHKPKLSLVQWRFGDCGMIVLADTPRRVCACWFEVEQREVSEVGLYGEGWRALVVKTPSHYYRTVYWHDGRIECEELIRHVWWERLLDFWMKIEFP